MKYFFIIILSLMSFVEAKPQQNGFVKIMNGTLHYKIYGKGNPILILNGGPGMNCEGFASLAKLLQDRYEVILFDQRGTGKSTLDHMDSTTITMDLMLQDMEVLRKKLGFHDWIVLGQSFGGMLASYYAANYPERVKAMILASSGGIDMQLFENVGNNIMNKLSKPEKDSMDYWDSKIKSGDTSHYALYHRALGLAPAYVYDKKNIPLIAERLTQGVQEVNSLVYKDLFKIKFDCRDKLKNFQKPVLIIQGKQDIVGEEIAVKAHEVLVNSRMVFIDHCVHYGWLDQPVKFMGEINSFLEKTNKGI